MKLPFTKLIRPIFKVMEPSDRGYRPDIDGMRAIAVLMVVAYHYFPDVFPGGFIGVDVFFVISGYLITGILVKSFERQSFGTTLLDFYQRRIRRIFPAVSLVLLFLLVMGWLFLFPAEYASLGKHVAGSAGFVENIILWNEAGYFDSEAIMKPLLHFWSLAVEEQFYIFWPLVLWFSMRRKWPLLDCIMVIIALSLASNVWFVWKGDATSSFFLPTMRAWELMVGAWLVVAKRQGVLPRLPEWATSQLSWFGLTLILVGFAIIHPEDAFPGLWALFPVLGSALIIHAGGAATLNRWFLSWRPAVWIGLISYPLYLWHWALWSMTVKVFGSTDLWVMREYKFVNMVLSILLSWLTYRLLEVPVRKRGGARMTGGLFLIVAILGLSGWGIFMASGLNNRPSTLVPLHAVQTYLDSRAYSPMKPECYDIHKNKGWPAKWSCTLGDKNAETTVGVMGDSHAMALIPAFNKIGKKKNIRFIFSSKGACSTLLGVTSHFKSPKACALIPQKMLELAAEGKLSAVVIAERWVTRINSTVKTGSKAKKDPSALKYGLQKTVKEFAAQDVPVLLLKDTPWQHADLPMAKLRGLSAAVLRSELKTSSALNESAATVKRHHKDQARVDKIIEGVAKHYSKDVVVVDLSVALCGKKVCPWARGGKFLYYDDNHLSVAGAKLAYPVIDKGLGSILN